MWFRLREEYVFGKGAGVLGQGIASLKKGAPITLSENYSRIVFFYNSFLLPDLTLEDLEIPDQCFVDEGGDLFCAVNKCYFPMNYKKWWIIERIDFCPGCGRKISKLPSISGIEEKEKHEVRVS